MRSSSSGKSSTEVPIGALDLPVARVLLVDPEEHAVAFALEVRESLEVGDGGHVALDRGDRGDLIGDEVVVHHRHERMVDAHHVADPARPQPGRVHDVFGGDRALLGLDPPPAAGERHEREHPVVLDHLGASLARGPGVGLRGAVRIEVAFERVEEPAVETLRVDDGDHLDRLVGRKQVGVGVLSAEPVELRLQPLPPLGRAGELHAAAHVQPDALTALLFDLGV